MKKLILVATMTSVLHVPALASDNDYPDGLRQRGRVITGPAPRFPIANLANIDRAEADPNCQETSFLGSFWSGVKSFTNDIIDGLVNHSIVPWPDLSQGEEPQQIRTLGVWGDIEITVPGLASNGALLVRTSPPKQSPTPTQDEGTSFELAAVASESLSQEADEERELSSFIDILRQHPEYNINQILALLDTPEKCEIGFSYIEQEMDQKRPLRGLNFENTPASALPEFVKYLMANESSFQNLRLLNCRGHSLTPALTAALLKLMVTGKRGETSDAEKPICLDLSPSDEINHGILVALAARYTERFPGLKISITGARLPAEFFDLELKPNLTLSLCRAYQSDSSKDHFEKIRQIILEKKTTINFRDGKKLNLKN